MHTIVPHVWEASSDADTLPSDFDPQQHPILARHWLGIEPRADARQTAFNARRVESADLIRLEAA